MWEATSTYLRRGKGDKDAEGRARPVRRRRLAPASLAAPGDLGREYAAVSGDHNPIHLYPLTAKAFGFPRQIAHGMWTKARCVAALENRLPDAVRVEVEFKKPIFLPGTVTFGSRRRHNGLRLLADQPEGRQAAPAGPGSLSLRFQRLSPNGTGLLVNPPSAFGSRWENVPLEGRQIATSSTLSPLKSPATGRSPALP